MRCYCFGLGLLIITPGGRPREAVDSGVVSHVRRAIPMSTGTARQKTLWIWSRLTKVLATQVSFQGPRVQMMATPSVQIPKQRIQTLKTRSLVLVFRHCGRVWKTEERYGRVCRASWCCKGSALLDEDHFRFGSMGKEVKYTVH